MVGRQALPFNPIEKSMSQIGPFQFLPKSSRGKKSKTSLEPPLDDTGFGCHARFTFRAPIRIDPNLEKIHQASHVATCFLGPSLELYAKKHMKTIFLGNWIADFRVKFS